MATLLHHLNVAGAPAKKAPGVVGAQPGEATHRVYIWRDGDSNPRLVTIRQSDAREGDQGMMELLLERLVANIQPG